MSKQLRKDSIIGKRLVKTSTFLLPLLVALAMIFSSIGPAAVVRDTSEEKEISIPLSSKIEHGNTNKFIDELSASQMIYSSFQETFIDEGFEEGTMPPSGGWYTVDENTNRPWTIVDAGTYPDFVHSGQYAAWINFDDTTTSDNWLVTPDINLSGYDEIIMKFWTISDTLFPGATMQLIIRGDGINDTIWDMVEDETWDDFFYREMTFDLSSYAGEIINISWRYVGFDGESFGLDDVLVYEKPDLDVGVTSIDSPESGTAGVITPQATVRNFGTDPTTGVPVNMKIGYTQLVGGSFEDFELNDGGFVASADWGDLTGDWEWTDSYNFSNYVGSDDPPPAAHSGDGLWGTVLYDDYTNAGGTSFLKKTYDFSGLDAPVLTFWCWSDINGYFDYGTINVNGDEVFYIDTYGVNEWEYYEIDLSDYSNMANVEVSFDFYASTVVERAGWYLDDIGIGELEIVDEYNETVSVDLDAGESTTVDFPEWTPDAWHTVEDVEITYDIWTKTLLPGDANSENDFLSKTVDLYYGYYHDIITTSLNPQSGTAGTLPVELQIENIGQYPECCFQVETTIEKEFEPVSILQNGFEEYSPRVDIFPPAGWTIEQTNPYSTWFKDEPTDEMRASCDEDGSEDEAQDEWLITDTLDCSAFTNTKMEFLRDMYVSSFTGDSYCEVLGSIDNGENWTYLIANYSDSLNDIVETFDISWADGESQVKIAWHFVSTADTGLYDYFWFDDFWVGTIDQTVVSTEDFEGSWGPYGDNPPVGWTIVDNGDDPDPDWDKNDWYKYDDYSKGNVARVYYSPVENQDEWLISEKMDCSALTTVRLSFWHYLSHYTGGNYTVMGSIDNGSSFPYLIAAYEDDEYGDEKEYNITSWAAGESEVKIRFRYIDNDGFQWKVDDFEVANYPDVTTLLEESFSEFIPESGFPPAGWMQEDIINEDSSSPPDPNIWRAATEEYSTTPTDVNPFEGDDMAIYDCGKLYPQGSEARLITPSVTISYPDATIYRLKFMMYLSDYSSSSQSDLVIQVSSDGSNWTEIETISTYDDSDPGWTEQLIDISNYADQSIYIGFKAVDGGYTDIIIDNVDVLAYGASIVYDDMQCSGDEILPGESRTYIFDDWTPDELSSMQSASIDYTVKARHNMFSDTNTDNDLDTVPITLEYFHDTTVLAITEPGITAFQDVWLNYDSETNENAIGLTNGGTFESAIRLTPEELAEYDGYSLEVVRAYHGYGEGTAQPPHSGNVKIYAGDTPTQPGELLLTEPFTSPDGNDWFDVTLSEAIDIDGASDLWVAVEFTHDAGEYPMGCGPGPAVEGKGFWISTDGGSSWDQLQDVSSLDYNWNIWAGLYAGAGVFLQPGTHPVAAVIENIGVFPETDIPVNAQIYNANDELIYESNTTVASIDVGGTATATFDSWTINTPGEYELEVTTLLQTDDYPENDEKSIGIGIDNTAPVTIGAIDPAQPDGDNDWYVSDVTISLEATDDFSGVNDILYRINEGSWQSYSDSVVINEDSDDYLVEFYAVDIVGNEEDIQSFEFKLDQTQPEIDLVKEEGFNKLTYIAEVSDDTSGVNRVEFFLNQGLQFVDEEAPYEWVLTPIPNANITVTAIVYDDAGNSATEEVSGAVSDPVVQEHTPVVLKTYKQL